MPTLMRRRPAPARSPRRLPRSFVVAVTAARRSQRMADAWALAKALGRTLYRVEAAQFEAASIGETEKNLRRLLARAAKAAVVVFYDEADETAKSRPGRDAGALLLGKAREKSIPLIIGRSRPR